jgi:glyoxylase-like metal-dependent hydrolase (beta-lactamase superfamily II)
MLYNLKRENNRIFTEGYMKLTKEITMLEIAVNVTGRPNMIFPVLLQCEENILVDSGYPGKTSLDAVASALEENGTSLKELSRVILTHQDLDHLGGLPGMRAENPGIVVCAHKYEKPYVEGKKKIIKISKDREHSLENLPENVRKALLNVFNNPPTSKVDVTFEDGETLPFCGGITVIHTPGHTPGHICLYLRTNKLLIAGDALTAKDGVLYGPTPEYAEDSEAAYASLKKLLKYDIESIICYHGGLVCGGADRIEELIKEHLSQGS